MAPDLSRRDLLRRLSMASAALMLPAPWAALTRRSVAWLGDGPDQDRLRAWTSVLRSAGLTGKSAPMGPAVVRVGEAARGTPYVAHTLEAYLEAGASPLGPEPLTLSLTAFDCVTLVEACIGVARTAAQAGAPTWQRFGREIERMRYRGGVREGYSSRLHYFSEWISDGDGRGLVQDLGRKLGGVADDRPLRFMTTHRSSYLALADDDVFGQIAAVERSLDGHPRYLIPTGRIPEVADQIRTGDVLAFATSIEGLDVTHAALAYRHDDVRLGVLHAPLSGGVVEIARLELPQYVAAIRRSTGILVARPNWG